MRNAKAPYERLLPALVLALVTANVLAWVWFRPWEAKGDSPSPEPPPAAGFVELATLMAEVQTLTHKAGLSIDRENQRLAEFYLEEVGAAFERIDEKVPVYRGMPVSELSQDILIPELESLQRSLAGGSWTASRERFDRLIEACNTCHAATRHDFIRITHNPRNSFSQAFEP